MTLVPYIHIQCHIAGTKFIMVYLYFSGHSDHWLLQRGIDYTVTKNRDKAASMVTAVVLARLGTSLAKVIIVGMKIY